MLLSKESLACITVVFEEFISVSDISAINLIVGWSINFVMAIGECRGRGVTCHFFGLRKGA